MSAARKDFLLLRLHASKYVFKYVYTGYFVCTNLLYVSFLQIIILVLQRILNYPITRSAYKYWHENNA